jgi:hypothetical protein
MRAGPSPLITVPRPSENGEQEVMTPMQWRDAAVGGQDTTGLSLDLPGMPGQAGLPGRRAGAQGALGRLGR